MTKKIEYTLLDTIRLLLTNESKNFEVPKSLEESFNPEISQIYISIFQEGLPFIKWGSKKEDIKTTILNIVKKLQSKSAFEDFDIKNCNKSRILFEMITDEEISSFDEMNTSLFNKHRYEPGITGIKVEYENKTYYITPNDAVVHSIMSYRQLLNYLSNKTGISKQTNKISERIKILHKLNLKLSLIKSISYVTYENQLLYLYRGYPIPNFSKENMFDSTIKSLDWLSENLKDDGSFLYFYDPTTDSKVDFEHPNMIEPLYYNILRHSGGTISLLRGYELTRNENYLINVEKSLDYLRTTFRSHQYKKEKAIYPFFNKKSKLGGAGIALVAFMHHYTLTLNDCYKNEIYGLVRHILSRISNDGEMIGYYIHPKYNNGKALLNPNEETKKELFSFYYPGEALLGLALFIKYMDGIEESFKNEILTLSKKALDFLIYDRPKKYKHLFTSLPSDAWLMQAIEEWIDIDDFESKSYIDFVFSDADSLIEHMYHENNSPYLDYVGGFFYSYGDHVYQDGARCEGLISAYCIARKLSDDTKASYYMNAMMKAAHGLMFTRHTKESTYAHRYPKKSIDSFRFKLTRSWVRIDSVQHTSCFFSRLYMEIENLQQNLFDEI